MWPATRALFLPVFVTFITIAMGTNVQGSETAEGTCPNGWFTPR